MDELYLDQQLTLDRCPHCSVSKPNVVLKTNFGTESYDKEHKRIWGIYVCSKCGGVITASAYEWTHEVVELYPKIKTVDSALPTKAKAFLHQANETIHSPSGSIMLSASCVDAMLKAKGYKEGSLYKRIEKAAEEHLITAEMAKWAHQVRLDANDERHADENAELPNTNDAKKLIEFTTALAQFLFVLPALIEQGIEHSKKE
ncbi:DUF4145 domain-containing protein [Flavobacterium psychrophilum]